MQSLFYWGGACSSGVAPEDSTGACPACPVASENGTGVGSENRTGVENRCDFSPLDLLNYLTITYLNVTILMYFFEGLKDIKTDFEDLNYGLLKGLS